MGYFVIGKSGVLLYPFNNLQTGKLYQALTLKRPEYVDIPSEQKIGFSQFVGYNLYSMKGMFIAYVYFQIPMGTLLLFSAFDSASHHCTDRNWTDKFMKEAF